MRTVFAFYFDLYKMLWSLDRRVSSQVSSAVIVGVSSLQLQSSTIGGDPHNLFLSRFKN
jgi:hypothetical protein